MSKEKVYEVPDSLMGKIIGILNQLPFGQVSPIMAELSRVVGKQPDNKDKKGK